MMYHKKANLWYLGNKNRGSLGCSPLLIVQMSQFGCEGKGASLGLLTLWVSGFCSPVQAFGILYQLDDRLAQFHEFTAQDLSVSLLNLNKFCQSNVTPPQLPIRLRFILIGYVWKWENSCSSSSPTSASGAPFVKVPSHTTVLLPSVTLPLPLG